MLFYGLIQRGKKMVTKRIPTNILLSEEVNNGLLDVGEKLGMNKSKTIRYICLDYLTKNNVLRNERTTLLQNL